DAVYDTAIGNVDYAAAKATATVSVTPASGPGGTVTVTATVTGADGLRPTGTVDFASSAGNCTDIALAPGAGTEDATATCELTVTPGATVAVTADYSGDGAYDTATATENYAAAKATPTVVVTPGSGPGGDITITATVTGTGGLRPTGTVDFNSTAGTCTDVALTAGTGTDDAAATCQLSITPGQTVAVTAAYTGDTAYDPATGDVDYVAAKATPSVVVTPDGQGPSGNVNFTASVSGTREVPTGTVDFVASEGLGGCTAVALVSGATEATGTCPLTVPSDTSVLVTVTYSGDAIYENTTGRATYQTPTATVDVAVAVSPGPAVAAGRRSVSLTAIVTSSDGGTPTGTVTITVTSGSESDSCTAVLVPGPGPGQASGTCPVTVTPGATVSVSAEYNGSGHYFTDSHQATYDLKRAATMTLVGYPQSPAAAGEPVTFTATVAGDSSGVVPTGTVRFEADGTVIAGCESLPVAAAACTVTLPAGSTRIVATYSGDTVYDPVSAEIADYAVAEPLAFTGDSGDAGAAGSATAEDEALAATGADVNGLALGGLLLILAGGGIVAIGATRRQPTR
ncbi:Ig-like domain repeat protein, partial [Actinophytocola sp.]|uniref:Ig-like domain repeat protein n=1 Tax=Actinophytocola sp. TaxID=1872138 RepID=UPI002D7E2A27